VTQTLQEIEQNIKSRRKTDRIMWFSMWAVLSVASFGIAWFPLIYYSIKRRNNHFSRQEKLEKLILNKLDKADTKEEDMETKSQLYQRNAVAWTISTILVIPSFYIFYVLMVDLKKHERQEHEFLSEIVKLTKDSEVPLDIQEFVDLPHISRDKFVALSVVTCGLAGVYWIYRIFNEYNTHFRMQWMLEDNLLSFLEELAKKQK
jgi:hypothetical protein